MATHLSNSESKQYVGQTVLAVYTLTREPSLALYYIPSLVLLELILKYYIIVFYHHYLNCTVLSMVSVYHIPSLARWHDYDTNLQPEQIEKMEKEIHNIPVKCTFAPWASPFGGVFADETIEIWCRMDISVLCLVFIHPSIDLIFSFSSPLFLCLSPKMSF